MSVGLRLLPQCFQPLRPAAVVFVILIPELVLLVVILVVVFGPVEAGHLRQSLFFIRCIERRRSVLTAMIAELRIRCERIDGAQGVQKLLVAMTRVTGTDHGAVEHSERRGQVGGVMAPQRPFFIGRPDWADLALGPAMFHRRATPLPRW